MIEIAESNAIRKYENYTAFDNAFREEIEKHEESFVRIGYLLKVARDTDVLRSSGYKTVFEYAKDLYGLDATTVSRYIGINDTYSIEGYSPELDDKYKSFGYAKLSEMLTLPPAIVEELEPEMTREDIRTIKKEYQEEQKITDIEVAIERAEVINNQNNVEQSESVYEPHNNMEKLLYGFFRDSEHAEEFASLVSRETWQIKDLYEWIAPSGTRTIIGRVPGEGRLQLTLKSPDQKVAVVNYRSGETEYFMWDDVTEYINKLVSGEENGRDRYKKVFGEDYPVSSYIKGNEETTSNQPEKKEEPKEKPKPKKVEVVKPKPEKKQEIKPEKKESKEIPEEAQKIMHEADEMLAAAPVEAWMGKPVEEEKDEDPKEIPAEAWYQRFLPYYREWNDIINRCSSYLYDIEQKKTEPKEYAVSIRMAHTLWKSAEKELEKILMLPDVKR